MCCARSAAEKALVIQNTGRAKQLRVSGISVEEGFTQPHSKELDAPPATHDGDETSGINEFNYVDRANERTPFYDVASKV